MRYFIPLITICLLILLSCSSRDEYVKAGEGFEYKIIRNGSGKKLEYGNFFAFHLKQYYVNGAKDTLLGDTREYMQRIEAFDSLNMPAVYIKALGNGQKGDSIVMRIATDSAYRKFISRMPKHFKSGGYIYTTIRILNIFENRRAADSANLAEYKLNAQKIYNKNLQEVEKKIEANKAQLILDSKIISTYLDKHKLKYTRGKWGTFIVIQQEGEGKMIAYDDVVAVDYTGRTLDSGKVFDSNLDPKFDRTGIYEVTMSKVGVVMPGWTDALLQLKKGTKATIYIPSSLGFGTKGWRSQIKPNENLVYDIQVNTVISEYKAMEIVSNNRIKTDSAQQRK